MDRLTRIALTQRPKTKKEWTRVLVMQYGKCIGDFNTPALAKAFIKRNALKNCDLIFANI